MQEETFRLPRSSYEELIKIIQAYASLAKEVSLDEVAQIAAVDTTVVSGNNAFLAALGIIQGGKKKSITPVGKELSLAIQHDLLPEVSRQWRAISTANSFMQKILSAVRIRKGMDTPTLQAHIAYSAGQPKNALTSTGAATVINILKIAELVREDNDRVLPSDLAREQPKTPQRAPSSTPLPGDDKLIFQTSLDLPGSPPVAVPVQIQLQISCRPEDLDAMGEKLRKLLSDLHGATSSTVHTKS